MFKYIRTIYRVFGFFFLTIPLSLLQIFILLFSNNAPQYSVARLYHRCICLLFGIKLTVKGIIETDTPIIYVFNHLSTMDISVIGSQLKISFVAKKEVSTYPVFGFLARLQNTLFIERHRNDVKRSMDEMQESVVSGVPLTFFPEGTSGPGDKVLPFKTSLFEGLKDIPNLRIQPGTLELTHIDGKPVQDMKDRNRYAWYGDMLAMPHIWSLLTTRSFHLTLHFHDALEVSKDMSRKDIANHLYKKTSAPLICT